MLESWPLACCGKETEINIQYVPLHLVRRWYMCRYMYWHMHWDTIVVEEAVSNSCGLCLSCVHDDCHCMFPTVAHRLPL